jgi:hypothetical protein
MWGRAELQAGNGAQHLFAQLAARDGTVDEGIAALERIAARLRSGEWSEALAALVAQAAALARAPDAQPLPTVCAEPAVPTADADDSRLA